MEHSAVLLLEIETSLGNVPESVRTRLEDEDGKRILGKSHYLGGDREVRWEEVPPGSWQLVVESDLEALARLPVRVPGPAVRIVLRSVGALETRVPGLVGEPVEAMFELLDVEGRSVRGPFRLHPESHRRGVRLNRLRPGTYVVRVSAEDGRSWQEVVVVAGDRKSEVVLE